MSKVTIVIPCFNQLHYLAPCVESLLQQSISDWHAVIVDDASMEGEASKVISNMTDRRIRVIRHERNQGLAAARNTGFRISKDALVLPLDADDLLAPTCLEEMIAEFEHDPDLDCVFSDFELFGARDGRWRFETKDMAAFCEHQWLPGAGVLMRKTIWEDNGGYCEDAALRGGNEDWDFWLSAAERGFHAAHIPRPLYRYRQHETSMALTLRKIDFETRKFVYARHRAFFDEHGGPRRFVAAGYWRASDYARTAKRHLLSTLRAIQAWIWDRDSKKLFGSFLATLKASIPRAGISVIKRVLGLMKRSLLALGGAICQTGGYLAGFIARNRSSLFFFFPSYEIGGAEKVHADIVRVFRTERPWVFFTQRSANTHFKPLFGDCRSFDLARWTTHAFSREFVERLLAGLINSHRNPVAFGGNSPFFYETLPHLASRVKKIDLVHAFGGGMEECSLPVARLLDARVVITAITRLNFARQYDEARLDADLLDRIKLIPNCVEVPSQCPPKTTNGTLRAIYVGRGSPEKRAHLIGAIARECRMKSLNVKISAAGDIGKVLSPREQSLCELLGDVRDPLKLRLIYDESDVLLLTSLREGFPLVVMESMAHGVVPVSTAVGGIPEHIHDGTNGFLVNETHDEGKIVEQFIQILSRLASDSTLLAKLSQSASVYAQQHFGGSNFAAAYQNLLRRPYTDSGLP